MLRNLLKQLLITVLSLAMILLSACSSAPESNTENVEPDYPPQKVAEHIIFPAYDEGEEYRKAVPLSPVFELEFSLPSDYSLVTDKDSIPSELILGEGLWNRLPIVDSSGIIVGVIGYNTIQDPFEGVFDMAEITPEFVYRKLTDGAYRYLDISGSYKVIKTSDSYETAICRSVWKDQHEDGIAILAYDKYIECYIVIEFLNGALTEEDAISIAESIVILPVTSGGPAIMIDRMPDYEKLAKAIVPGFRSVSKEYIGAGADFHSGIDISADEYSAIISPYDGTVTEIVLSDEHYGNYVVINYDTFSLVYASCKSVEVSVGEVIKATQVIARVGTSPESEEAHLHLELISDVSGAALKYDPWYLMHPENSVIPVSLEISST